MNAPGLDRKNRGQLDAREACNLRATPSYAPDEPSEVSSQPVASNQPRGTGVLPKA